MNGMIAKLVAGMELWTRVLVVVVEVMVRFQNQSAVQNVEALVLLRIDMEIP